MNKAPLVITGGQIEQLQTGDDLEIPLGQQVDELRWKFNRLVAVLLLQGVEIPDELTGEV